MSKFIASKQSHQVTQVHQYLRSFSFASPKENEPKEKATQKNAAQHTCLGSPAFLGGHAYVTISAGWNTLKRVIFKVNVRLW
jgi:hypothetical protein